jgi:hypothetical protein
LESRSKGIGKFEENTLMYENNVKMSSEKWDVSNTMCCEKWDVPNTMAK